MASFIRAKTTHLLLSLLLFAPFINAQDTSPNGPTFPNIASNCNAYHTVVDTDGCASIAATYGITLAEFYAWNPDISNDCGTNFWTGYAYCVGVGPAAPSSVTYTPPPDTTCACETSTTTGTTKTGTKTETETVTSTETTASASSNTDPYSTLHPITNYTLTATSTELAFPPTKTQAGQPENCDDWQLATAWDTCESIVSSNSWLTLSNLLAWNPALHSDCSGLYDGWWLCISVRPSSNIDIGWTTTEGSVDIPTITANYTPTTFPAIDPSFTASPTQPGIVSGCLSYYQAKDGDTCHNIVDGTILTEADFFAWNPALNNVCTGLWVNYWYCVAGPSGYAITAFPPTVASPTLPAPTPPNQIATCKKWYQRDGESCAEIAAMFGTFSEADFKGWNVNVGSGCTNLVDGWWYCVGVPGTPTTRSEPVQTTEVPDGTPTLEGMTGECAKLWFVGGSDTCQSIELANGITEADFLQWNPALAGTTTTCKLVRDYYVCVSIDGPPVTISTVSTSKTSQTRTSTSTSTTSPPGTGTTTTTKTTTAVTTTTSGGSGPITTPTPIRDGMTSSCHRFYYAQDGDGCWAIANAAGIDLK
ncbi:uncharacterized protein C8A04DRAFT_37436 [Dichotomopilus funicola]|uniref:LysM domain-containing protein n=1 Tax=Dichotomopilus funicola TaxID=1934379 RepID=A0AAN6V2U6_9PEZI|nr:hypothetical protein C8A04DRAFT_37436 [Dichotomopilus funicola]